MNLRNLQKYAITKNFFEEFQPVLKDVKDNTKPVVSIKKEIANKSSCKNHTEYYNSLFWTLYSVLETEHMTSMLENHKFKIKNDFAMKFVEDIKSHKGFLKEHKLRFHEIESSILYDKDISLGCLKAIVLFKKMNMVYIWNNRYYIFESNEDDPFNVIRRNREKYTFERNISKATILETMVNDKLEMEGVRSDLKSITSYKLDELKSIAKRLGICIETKKTKQVLYEEINSKID